MKYTIDKINEELQNGWKCVSQDYINLDSALEFLCPEGHSVFSTWKKIRSKAECPVCEKNFYKTQASDTQIVPKKKGEYRVLGLDQATHLTGWSIYSNGQLVKYGVFTADSDDSIARAIAVKNWLIQLIKIWQIDFVGMEGIQYQQQMGVTTFQVLAWLQGILMGECCELNVPYDVVHTAVWRNHCGVKGSTRVDKKRSMQLLAKKWYDVSVSEDVADAIGIGKYMADHHKNNFELISWD